MSCLYCAKAHLVMGRSYEEFVRQIKINELVSSGLIYQEALKQTGPSRFNINEKRTEFSLFKRSDTSYAQWVKTLKRNLNFLNAQFSRSSIFRLQQKFLLISTSQHNYDCSAYKRYFKEAASFSLALPTSEQGRLEESSPS